MDHMRECIKKESECLIHGFENSFLDEMYEMLPPPAPAFVCISTVHRFLSALPFRRES